MNSIDSNPQTPVNAIEARKLNINMKAMITKAQLYAALWAALLLAQNSFAYDQATVGTYPAAAPTGTIDKSATASPNDLAGFTSAVATAYTSLDFHGKQFA